jgi:hypothetical protein
MAVAKRVGGAGGLRGGVVDARHDEYQGGEVGRGCLMGFGI